MSVLPQRQSVVSHSADYLKSEITRGTWREWLPAERSLCRTLQVSRNTLRLALRKLSDEGVIRTEHGLGSRIAQKKAGRPFARPRSVGLLSPEPLERLRPSQTLWIDELRAMLTEDGCRFHVLHGQQYARGNPARALEKLVRLHPHGCWIPIRSNKNTQAWFQRRGEPCIVAGSCFSGIDLPFVDLDHRALCRHAAGVLLAKGHRRIALIAERTLRPGDSASELGFVEGGKASRHPDAEATVAWHEPTVESFTTVLLRLMRQKRPPTGLLVANPNFYLTGVTRLLQHGWRVPQDVSVLSRDDDPFLSFVVPSPACYKTPPHLFARRLLRLVLELLDSGAIAKRAITIMPEFVRGDSVGPPPGAAGN